ERWAGGGPRARTRPGEQTRGDARPPPDARRPGGRPGGGGGGPGGGPPADPCPETGAEDYRHHSGTATNFQEPPQSHAIRGPESAIWPVANFRCWTAVRTMTVVRAVKRNGTRLPPGAVQDLHASPPRAERSI